jgi:hypothetical protein
MHDSYLISQKEHLNFEESNLQEYKGHQISKAGRDSPRNVVLVQVQAYEILQVTKLRWDCSLNIVFVKLPVSLVMFNTSTVRIYEQDMDTSI